MDEIIKVNFNHEKMVGDSVSARELHEKLGINQRFTDWFKYQQERMRLVEGTDFIKVKLHTTKLGYQDPSHGGDRKSIDYIVSVHIAKHLCMMSQGEKAYEIRQNFIDVEKQWNSPEAVMNRAYEIIRKENLEFQKRIANLQFTPLEQKPKVD